MENELIEEMKPTCELRWKLYWEQNKTLEQKWISSDGEMEEWREIEFFDEDK